MKGLEFRKTADAIAAFVSQHPDGPRRAVFCTFDFHPARFEAILLPELTGRRRWFRTLVMADQAQLQKTDVLTQRDAGATYELVPVRLRAGGVFHPKLIVLQAGERLCIGIGSANLTPGGLGGNLELMLFASNDSADGRAVTASAMQFLYELSRASAVVLPESAKQFLDRLWVSAPRVETGPIAHNLDRPLIQKLAEGRPKHVTRAAVVSPWHSSTASARGVEPTVLRRVTEALGARPTVFTEGQSGKASELLKGFPVRILKSASSDDSEELEATEVDEDSSHGPRRPASLHAKAYLTASRQRATLWLGSANCTVPALLRTAKNGGNVEVVVRVDLERTQVARVESDLARMFETPRGFARLKASPRIPSPRGVVLAAYVSDWGTNARVRLEVVKRSRLSRVSLSRTAKPRDAISVTLLPGATSLDLDARCVEELLNSQEPPSVLWEHLARGAVVAVPVSVACASASSDPEEQLADLLDEFSGRVPASFRGGSRTRVARPGPETPGEQERDPELALLTRTEHQGRLDRIAVRVELLRRRLARTPLRSPEAVAYYRSVIEKLEIDGPVKSILIEHLGAVGRLR